MSIPLQILYPSSVSWKATSLYFFSSNNIYFAQKDPIKVKIFETFERSGQNLLNSLCQFSNGKSIPLQILYPSSISWKITALYFVLAQTIHTLLKRSTLKWSFLRLSAARVKNSSNSSCKFWNDKSILLHILHPSSLPVDFKLILFLHWIKGSHQNPNFQTFNCSGENLHIPHVTLQTTSFLKFCITLQYHER